MDSPRDEGCSQAFHMLYAVMATLKAVKATNSANQRLVSRTTAYHPMKALANSDHSHIEAE
jgi:hypothetical protein